MSAWYGTSRALATTLRECSKCWGSLSEIVLLVGLSFGKASLAQREADVQAPPVFKKFA